MTPEVIGFVRDYGLPLTILIVAAWTGARGTWVWGRELRAADSRASLEQKRADEWQRIALHALQVGEKVVEKVNGK